MSVKGWSQVSYPRTHAEAAPVPAPFPMPAITARGRTIDDEDMERSVREKGYDVVCKPMSTCTCPSATYYFPVGIATRGIIQARTHV